MMKECYKCKIIKPLTDFHKSKNKKDGLESKCKSCVLEYSKIYYQENTTAKKNRVKCWEENNPERKKFNRKSYSEKNKEKEKEYSQNRFKKLYSTNPEFKIIHCVRNRINRSIKNRSNSTEYILGCNIKDYLIFLENQFDDNMCWDNYGVYWEIDHIKPINTFNQNEKMQAFYYKNTRPLPIDKNRTRPRNGRDLFGESK